MPPSLMNNQKDGEAHEDKRQSQENERKAAVEINSGIHRVFFLCFFEKLADKTSAMAEGLRMHAKAAGVPLTPNEVGGMFGYFFTKEEKVTNFAQVSACDVERFKKFYHGMLQEGVYLAPSAYEAGFVSSSHSDDDIADTLAAADKVLATL